MLTTKTNKKHIFLKKTLRFSKRVYIFAPTVPLLLPIRTAQGSFFYSIIYNNTPFLPIHDAH